MVSVLLNLVFNIVALYVVVNFVPGVDYTGGIALLISAGVLIAILNKFVRPILRFLSMPLTFLSAGLFLVVINAVIFYLVDYLLEVFDFEGVDLIVNAPLTYLWIAIIFGLVNWFEHWLFKEDD